MEKQHKKQFHIKKEHHGSILFLSGLLIVIVSGLLNLTGNSNRVVVGILITIGILIGILNITRQETVEFLVAGFTLVILSGSFLSMVNQMLFASKSFNMIFSYLIALIVPAVMIVAMKSLFLTAKDE